MRFNDILSVQTMINIKTMKFLGHIVRGPVNLPPRQLLIASIDETMGEIHIDFVGSLQDWYFDARLDNTFWNMLIECL